MFASTQLEPGLFGRAAAQVRQFLCGLHGHDALLHFEQGRLSLQCTSCGHETPGWDLKGRAVAQAEPAAAPPRAVRLPLLGARRVA
jgi:hypothetical protein